VLENSSKILENISHEQKDIVHEKLNNVYNKFKTNISKLDEIKYKVETIYETADISEKVKFISEDLSEKVDRKHFDDVITSQSEVIDYNFNEIVSQLDGINKRDILIFEDGVKSLTEIVDNLVEVEIPQSKLNIFSKFDLLEEGVQSEIDKFSSFINEKVNKLDTQFQNSESKVKTYSKYIESSILDITKTYKDLHGIVEDKHLDYSDKIKEYSDTLRKFNIGFELFENKFNNKFEEYKQSLDSIVSNEIEERLQSHLNEVNDKIDGIPIPDLDELRKDIFEDVSTILNGDVKKNILNLERKIEDIQEKYEELSEEKVIEEGLLNIPPGENNSDPLTPLDQNFATLDDLSSHYRLFLNRIQQQLSTIGGGGENNTDGFEWTSDKNLESNPLTLPIDTWVQITNDATSSTTVRDFLPKDCSITRVWSESDNKIYLNELSNEDWIIFRMGLTCIPSVNDTTVRIRLKWTTTDGITFYLTPAPAVMNEGAGDSYENQFVLPFYVGNDPTRKGSGIVEARCNHPSTAIDFHVLGIMG